ncbi:MAG: hypothetical protein Q8W44_04985 [Candidatus Palauibacterales bacterium]|nr:hypothetical protein [Candidatus Palauibacterales bacterium]
MSTRVTRDAGDVDTGAAARPGSVPQPPAWGTVLAGQARLLARKKWKSLLVLLASAGLLVLLRFSDARSGEAVVSVVELLLASPLHVFAFLAAYGWAAGVWSDEGPGERAYHWSLPVTRPAHDLTRVGLGAVFFLVTGAAAVALWTLPVAALTGAITPGPVRALALVALLLLLGYLLGTVPALLSDHPARWSIGVFLGYAVGTGLLMEAAERWRWIGSVPRALASVWSGELGLRSAMFAPQQIAGYAEETVTSSPALALFLWLGLAASAVVALSFVHLERAKGAAG